MLPRSDENSVLQAGRLDGFEDSYMYKYRRKILPEGQGLFWTGQLFSDG